MQVQFENIEKVTADLRKYITEHPVYKRINCPEDLNAFMEHHVYAVWDFMSLLKSLQSQLTCTSVPWFPVGDPEIRYFINEIVCGEESDADETGVQMSHFELYIKAMEQSGANTKGIHTFLQSLKSGSNLEEAFEKASTPASARDFVRYTFDVIHTQPIHVQAAVFTFGREDLIPGMFHTLVADINKQFPDKIETFKYYLDRHIEVDGDHHGALSLKMVAQLCGDDKQKWVDAQAAAIKCLRMRANLWDGVLSEIEQSASVMA